jgi:hypothetical protein
MVKVIIAVLRLCSLTLVVVMIDVTAIRGKSSNIHNDCNGSSCFSSSSRNHRRAEFGLEPNQLNNNPEDNNDAVPNNFLRKKSSSRSSKVLEESNEEEEMLGMRLYNDEKKNGDDNPFGAATLTDVPTEDLNFKQLHNKLSEMDSGGPPPMHWTLVEEIIVERRKLR